MEYPDAASKNRWARALNWDDRRTIVFDVCFVALGVLMQLTSQTIILFHAIFVSLAIMAMYQAALPFMTRVAVYVGATVALILEAISVGKVESGEATEIPLLTAICVFVFLNARLRQTKELELDRQRAFLAAVLDNTTEGILVCDRRGEVVLANEASAALGLVALDHGRVTAYHPRFSTPDEGRSLDRSEFALERALAGEIVPEQEVTAELEDHREVVLLASGKRMLGRHGEVIGAVSIVRDITERKTLERELKRQALFDPLTDLANRALFNERISHALQRSDRHGYPVAVLFIDLDDFKDVNDNLGHAAGDQLLVGVADRLKQAMRACDTVARLGGDEFAVLIEDLAGASPVETVAERVLDALRSPFMLDGHSVQVQASVGISVATCGSIAMDEMLRNADTAMYTAKGKGKGRYQIFGQPDNEERSSATPIPTRVA